MSPRIEDDGGPSDEEGSSASEQIQHTPSNIEPEEDDTSEPESVENVPNPATDNNGSDVENDEKEQDIADNSIDLAESEAEEEKEQLDKSDEPLPWQPSSQSSTPAKSGYESFGGKSPKLPTPFKHEDETPLDESPHKPKSRIASKAARGQVLVHYHPQLGDEGFESTLVEEPNNAVEISTPSRGRPMDESNYYAGGAAGMNSRMMEDVRVGRAYTNNSQAPPSPMNDEQNNAATRQIRRRVFRAALERGLHDERRRKMLDADADIGGPSLRGDGAGIRKSDSFDAAYAAYSRQTTTKAMNLTRSRNLNDEDEGGIPIKTDIPTNTPKSNDTSLVEDVNQTVSPPAPPSGAPSYRTIIHTLIADNEPQKLPQLEKVLKKYQGREEELILKLDLRYKKMKKKSGLILQDLEQSEKQKFSVASKSSGEGRQSLGSYSGIKQTYSWDSRKSKDLYFVKVASPERPLPGAIKLPNDIIDSSKTAPHSNVRTVLAIEDEVSGDIPVIPRRDPANAQVSETKFKVAEKEEEAAPTPVSQEPYKFKKTPSYGDGISVITMETKGTLKAKKNERGEEIYTWQQRPPNSITVEGSKGTNGNVKESPLSPVRQAKINKLLPDYEREKEEDKFKANDTNLGSTLDNVEARIRARRKIMEAEAKNKDDGRDDNNIEKGIDGVSEVDGASLVVEDIDSFVGKPKSFVSAPADEREVQLSLIDQQDLLVESKPPESAAVKEEPATTKTSESESPVEEDVDDDLDEEEEIDLLLKESRLQAEKAIALKKAQRELEKEKKARLEAEAARIALEEELSRLKAGAVSDASPQEEAVADGDSEENDIDNTDGEKDDTTADSFKYDLNKTFSSVSDEKSHTSSDEIQGGDDNAKLLLEDNEQILSEQIDVTGASTELVGSSQNQVDVDQESHTVDDDGNGEAIVADVGAPIPVEDETSNEVKLTSESPQLRDDIISPPSVGDGIAQSPTTNETHPTEHPGVPVSPQRSSAENSDTDEGTNINHIATTNFEGNRAKGQLSFITGARILAHSNQRGPWWLGRCGKQTGWFPANVVVPESEFLANISSAVPAEMDDTKDGLGKLSNEELAATYDLIRNPSDTRNDEIDDKEDDMNGSPARSRWLDDDSNQKSGLPSRSDSPPPSRSDPSQMEGLDQRIYEADESDAIAAAPQLGFEGMNRLGKSIEELSEDKPKKMYIGPPQAIAEIETTEIEPTKTTQTRSGWQLKKKKKVQEWKAVKDPDTGLTYYYHLKTRETTWDKPADFDEATIAEKDDGKSKGLSGGKILRIFSKKKKSKTPTEDNPTPTFSFDENKGTYVPQPATKTVAKSKKDNLVAKRPEVKKNSDIVFPQYEDDSSSSDGSSLFSRDKISTKQMFKSTVEKISEKLTQKNDSPKNSYEQLVVEEEKTKVEEEDSGLEINYSSSQELRNEKPVQWRSAIDAASGRTYYYVKGGKETFWEKPIDMM